MIVVKIDGHNPDMKAIRTAADAIKRGELVVFPTETVYGLACDALDERAVKGLMDVKGRADTQPLPVQIPGLDHLQQAATFLPDQARMLAEKYWPGPLTIVLEKQRAIPDLVTAGKNTVGVRVPDHPVALALVTMVGRPIVATSANISGREPANNAQEAINQLGGAISVVLDAGESKFGVASTVVDMSTVPPKILRAGAIPADEIRDILGEISRSAK